jgi:hypothetical protein
MTLTTAAELAVATAALDLMSRKQVATLLGVHVKTVSKISDKLRPLRISPGVQRWRRSDVLRYLESLATAG